MTHDPERAAWNDAMYEKHPTPYGGISGRIEQARLRAVLGLARITARDAVLELGCEAGNLLVRAPRARRLVGADISARALADARLRFAARGREVELLQLDAEQPLPWERGTFEVVLCSEMLEHVDHPERVIGSIAALCTPDTRVVISVPIEGPKVAIKAVLARLGLLDRFFAGIERGQSEWHVHAFSPAMLRGLVAEPFVRLRERNVWLMHHVMLLRLRG